MKTENQRGFIGINFERNHSLHDFVWKPNVMHHVFNTTVVISKWRSKKFQRKHIITQWSRIRTSMKLGWSFYEPIEDSNSYETSTKLLWTYRAFMTSFLDLDYKPNPTQFAMSITQWSSIRTSMKLLWTYRASMVSFLDLAYKPNPICYVYMFIAQWRRIRISK